MNNCDAVLSAYTGLIHRQGEANCLGNEEEGWLVLPRAPRWETFSKP